MSLFKIIHRSPGRFLWSERSAERKNWAVLVIIAEFSEGMFNIGADEGLNQWGFFLFFYLNNER